jgi:hypothetical protein
MKGFIKRIKSLVGFSEISNRICRCAHKLHPGARKRKIFLPAQKAWGNQMQETEIKRLMKSLGESINETLADSPKINERILEIRDAGYEIFLIIEAKIGFSRKVKEDMNLSPDSAEEPVQMRITSEDVKFLKSLKISTEDN